MSLRSTATPHSDKRQERDRCGRLIRSLLVAGLVIRLVLALTLETNGDLLHIQTVAHWLTHAPLDVYRLQKPHDLVWPYPPGYFPFIVLGSALHHVTGLAFAFWMRVPVIAANMVLVWLVDVELRRRYARDTTRVVAAGVLMLAPLSVLESAWHGQIDMVALCFAVGACVVWERRTAFAGAGAAGLLIGAAGSIKIVPGLVLIALLPHVRSRRELAYLVGGACAVPVVLLAPWLIHDPHALIPKLSYHGLPGIGGVSVLVQPDLSHIWLLGERVFPSGWTLHLQQVSNGLTIGAVAAATVVIYFTRPKPAVGAVLLFLAIYVGSANLALHYALWILPFLLIAGFVGAAVISQVALLVPVFLVYMPAVNHTLATRKTPWSSGVVDFVFVPSMDLLWAATLVSLSILARWVWKQRGPRAGAARAVSETVSP